VIAAKGDGLQSLGDYVSRKLPRAYSMARAS
jgi:hypothetical protein